MPRHRKRHGDKRRRHNVQAFMDDLANQFRLADALDIAIVSVLIYLALTWICGRASRSLGIVVASLIVLFLLARWLDMYLTTMLFQFGFLGLVLTLVVVFQDDIRHGFERLASSRWFRRSSSDNPSEPVVDALVQSIHALGDGMIGALLVFPGRQPLDRHLRGGVAVDAEISLPLLLSIFHPKSPGHDGAVLIEGERIDRLGVHLPLSANLQRIEGGATRHAAALGLSECCDAIVVAVSEERGTISIAQGGELATVDAPALAKRLRTHYATQDGPVRQDPQRRLRRLATKFASVLLAVVLWFVFAYRTDTVQRTFNVPVEYRNLDDQWVIQEPKPTRAEVTLVGSEQAFELLDATNVAVSLELSEIREGAPMRLSTEPSLTNVPSELRVDRIIPEVVHLSVRRKPPPAETN